MSSTTNIKSIPLLGHIGAYKFSNDDWGTIAYSIPRNQLQRKFTDKEFNYNSIYLLFGFRGTTEVVYVGQAKKRNGGGSVLIRLREHDKSTVEKYCESWEWAVALTNKDDAWGLDELNALEHIISNRIPSEQRLNGNTPNYAGANFKNYDEKVRQIENLVTAIGFQVFNKDGITENVQVTQDIGDNQFVEDLQNWESKIPEIITPTSTVKSMLDLLPLDVWNSSTKFLDPACKGGEYLKEVYDRLMKSNALKAEFPNIIERSNHILKNQIYGIALSRTSLDRTTKKLLGEDRNIKLIPDYIKLIKLLKPPKKGKADNKSIMEALAKEFGSTMEFDVIIGNPPYQETTGGGKGGGGNTMYDKFILLGLELSQKYVSFVVPARWYTDETRTAYLRKKLLDNDRIIELHDFPDTDDLFKGVWIMGGVCYFLWDAKYSGECKFVEHRKGSTVESKRCLRNSHSDILIRNIDALTIVDKVLSKNEIPITEYMYNYNTFKLRSYERGDLIRTSDDQIEMYYTGNGIRGGAIAYIDRSYVCASTDLIDKHKIYINSVSDNMLAFPYKVLYPAFYGAPGTVCTESYMVIGPIKGEQYSKAVIDYLATKFVKALVLQCKTSQTTYKRVYKFVPSQDFTENSDIDWSKSVENINRQLYKKYNLSDSEIDYIERMIQ